MEENEIQFSLETRLNGRIEIQLKFLCRFLPTDDPSLENEKRLIYQQLPPSHPPQIPQLILNGAALDYSGEGKLVDLLQLESSLEESDYRSIGRESLPILLPRLSLSNQVGERALFQMLTQAEINNLFNTYLVLYLGKPSLVRNLFVNNYDKRERDRQFQLLKPVIEKWMNLREINQIAKELSLSREGFLMRKSLRPEVVLQSLGPRYMRGLLERSERIPMKGSAHQILVVDLADRSIDWMSLVENYRKENAGYPLPADYLILDRAYLSLLLMTPDLQSIRGYIVFSLRPVFDTHSSERFKQKEFSALEERLRERGDVQYRGCGYDLLSVEGIHLASGYEGNHFSRILLFTMVEFARLSQEDLGHQLLCIQSHRASLKDALVNEFGFSFYNQREEFRWFLMKMKQYISQREGIVKSYKPSDGVTLVDLFQRFSVFRDQYYASPQSAGGISPEIDSFYTILEFYQSHFRDREYRFREETWPIMVGEEGESGGDFPSPSFKELVEKMQKFAPTLKDDLDERTLRFLGELPTAPDSLETKRKPKDTFLFLTGNILLEERLDRFYNEYIRERRKQQPLPVEQPPEKEEEMEVEFIRKLSPPPQIENITEEDMFLYERVVKMIRNPRISEIESDIKRLEEKNKREREKVVLLERKIREMEEKKKKETQMSEEERYNRERAEYAKKYRELLANKVDKQIEEDEKRGIIRAIGDTPDYIRAPIEKLIRERLLKENIPPEWLTYRMWVRRGRPRQPRI